MSRFDCVAPKLAAGLLSVTLGTMLILFAGRVLAGDDVLPAPLLELRPAAESLEPVFICPVRR